MRERSASHGGSSLRRRVGLVAALVIPSVLVFAGLSYAASTIEAVGSTSWSNNTQTIDAGESITFKNSTGLPHGVKFGNSVPATPGCAGSVPTGGASNSANWEGSCSFATAGSYPFACPVHPGMAGTITVNSTGPGAPTATTGSASSLTDTGASLGGSVNPNGQATEYFFRYGTTASYGQTTTKTLLGNTGNSPTSVTPEPITGLTPGTTYHFQLVAENVSGTSPGSDQTFQTPGPPLVTTGGTSAIADTTATVLGSVTPRGHQTTYFFEYGTTEAYGQKTTSKSAGQGVTSVPVNAALSGLTAETTYHYRLVAVNSSDEVEGADKTFKTTAKPAPPPPEEEKPPVVTPPIETPVTPIVTPPAEAPDTKLTSKPKASSKDKTPTFKFSATVSGASFECQLDGKAFAPCRSPLTTKPLKPGRHSFKVRAVGPTGVEDPSPASVSFKIVKPKKKRKT
jgi:plastocyanin